MGQGQLRGRHMGQPLHIVDHLLREGQAPHREDLMMQGPPRQDVPTLMREVRVPAEQETGTGAEAQWLKDLPHRSTLIPELFARCGMKLTVRNKTQHSIKDQNKFTFPGVDESTEKKISIRLKRGDPNFGQSSHREIHEQSSTRRTIEFTEFSISGGHTLNSTRFSVQRELNSDNDDAVITLF